MAAFIAILLLAAIAWVTFTTIWLWRHQERIVFQPPAVTPEAPPSTQRVDYAATDGHRVFGYVVRPSPDREESRDVLLIAFHGNADLAAWFVPWAQAVAERTGLAVLLPEYRGYAAIAGLPTYETAAADARGALDFARRELGATRFVYFGHSLGTAVATELAKSDPANLPAVLVLQSPFTSARAMATRMLVPPFRWLWRRISRVHYDTRSSVRVLACPVWVSHGTRDVVVPYRMGRAVYDAALHKGEFLSVAGAGHNDVAEVGGDEYWAWLCGAVRVALPRAAQRRV